MVRANYKFVYLGHGQSYLSTSMAPRFVYREPVAYTGQHTSIVEFSLVL